MKTETDIVIVGTGVSGLFAALNLPRDRRITMITKSDAESSDSFLAQGGICVLRDDEDYDSYFEDTRERAIMRTRKESGGHYDPQLQGDYRGSHRLWRGV